MRRQLSRWTRDGKVVQLRRGLYMLASPYRKLEPHPFFVANRLEASLDPDLFSRENLVKLLR